MSRDYRKLDVFKLADELAFEIYRATNSFPKSELFGLTSQLRRAALSVPTNIVEGSQRESSAEYIRFLDIALGSLAEVGYQLDFAKRLGYFTVGSVEPILAKHEQCIRMLKGLIRSCKTDFLKK